MLERAPALKARVEGLTRRNPSERLIDAAARWRDGDFTVLYRVKECVRSSLNVQCNA